jgi:hypothetical protein
VGGIARRVLKRAYGVVFRDAIAAALYTLLGLTIAGALAGIV